MALRQMWLAVCIAVGVFPASGQQVTYNPGPSNDTRANPNDVSVSYGAVPNRPKNYEQYYYGKAAGYSLPPLISPSVYRSPIVLGPVRPYTDEEYSKLVLSTLNVGTVLPASAVKIATRSIVVALENREGTARGYKRAESRAIDVLDRGILLIDTHEELRLRGVRMLSERDTDDIYRYYAREGMRYLRDLTKSSPIYVNFEDPLRDADGSLLGIVYLKDGTQLNKLMLEQGYGRLEPRDFTDDRDIAEWVAAEKQARDARIGIWSRQ